MSTPGPIQPVTTLHVALYGIHKDDGRLGELVDLIDRWADDSLGIEEPAHSRDTYFVPSRSGAGVGRISEAELRSAVTVMIDTPGASAAEKVMALRAFLRLTQVAFEEGEQL